MKEKAPKAGITMADIAQAANVHPATVSRVLKNDPRISEKTKKDILAIANQLGYRPNPLISALSTLRRQHAQVTMPTALAYIQREKLRPTDHIIGMREMAKLHGYKVELFTINDQMSEQRLNQILTNRNIRGLILAPLTEAHGSFTLDWERFATVALEYSFTTPRFDRVVPDSFQSVMLAMEKCIQLGHTRVGLVLTRTVHERNEGLLSAAYLYAKEQNPSLVDLKPFIAPSRDRSHELTAWITHEKPQVIISSNHMIEVIHPCLQELNITVPNQIGIVNLNTFPEQIPYAGISLDPEAMGSRATELLINKLNNNQFGIPAARMTIIGSDLEWVDGETLLSVKDMTWPAVYRRRLPAAKAQSKVKKTVSGASKS